MTTFLLFLLTGAFCTVLVSSEPSLGPELEHSSVRRVRKDHFGHFNYRYADCVQCFDRDELQECNQIVLSCPLYLVSRNKRKSSSSLPTERQELTGDTDQETTILVAGTTSGDQIDGDLLFSAHYNNLIKKENKLKQNYYCLGMFSKFVKEKEQICTMNIGTSKDIIIAGLSYVFRNYLRQYIDSNASVICIGWAISSEINTQTNAFGVPLSIRNSNIIPSQHVATISFRNIQSLKNAENINFRNVLLSLMAKYSWSESFSANPDHVKVTKIGKDKLDVKVALKS